MGDMTYTALTKVIYGTTPEDYAKSVEALMKHDQETMELLSRTHSIVHASTVVSYMPTPDALLVFVALVYREKLLEVVPGSVGV